tara:strand:- start:234 stop:560 length:327 start_codon:yes stop_codon:yes gene_type:complete
LLSSGQTRPSVPNDDNDAGVRVSTSAASFAKAFRSHSSLENPYSHTTKEDPSFASTPRFFQQKKSSAATRIAILATVSFPLQRGTIIIIIIIIISRLSSFQKWDQNEK